MTSDKLRIIHFENKKELTTGNVAKEVGELKVERQEEDEASGEIISITEKIQARKVRDYLKEKVVESGDSLTQVKEKLRNEHGQKNDKMDKRNKVVALFKSIFKSGTADDYKKMKDEEIKKAA